MKKVYLKATTTTQGAATVTSTEWVLGELKGLAYLPGTIDTGATITITAEGPMSKAILTKASAGTSNTFYYPRDLVHAVADGAALTGTAGGDRAPVVLDGKIKLVVASGGDTKTGAVVLYYE